MATSVPFFPGLGITNRNVGLTNNQTVDLCVTENTALRGGASTGPYTYIEIETSWASIENDRNAYDFTEIVNACDYAAQNGIVVRVLLTTKYTKSPRYMRLVGDIEGSENGTAVVGDFGPYGAVFKTGTGGGSTRLHRLFLASVRARWNAMFDAFTANVVNYTNAGNPAKQARVRAGFYGVCLQETHGGVLPGTAASQGLPNDWDDQYVLALIPIHTYIRTTGMPTRALWQMVNSTLRTGTGALTVDGEMLENMKLHGVGMSAPDTFPWEPHVTKSGKRPNGVRQSYDAQVELRDLLMQDLHLYPENGGKPWHGAGDVTTGSRDGHPDNVFPQAIFALNAVPPDPPGFAADTDNNGGRGLFNFVRDGLQLHNWTICPTDNNAGWTFNAGSDTWSGDPDKNPTFNLWTRVKAALRAGSSGVAGVAAFSNANGAGGMNTDIPSSILVGTAPLPVPTIALTTANTIPGGASTTNNATANKLQITDLVASATAQWALSAAGPWNSAQPTYVTGSNTVYARQRKADGSVSPATAAFTFTYDPSIASPTITWAGPEVTLTYGEPLASAGAGTTTYTPPKTSFDVKVGGSSVTINTRYLSAAAGQMTLTLAATPAPGSAVTVSYTAPANGHRDVAGNLAANLTNAAATESAGGGTPTTTATITSVIDDVGAVTGPITSGGAIDDTLPVLTFTLSSALAPAEQLVVYRGGVEEGAATGSGTTYTYTPPVALADGAYSYTARVEAGSLNGTMSDAFAFTVMATPPNDPTVTPLFTTSKTPTISGTWTNVAGHTLEVIAAGTTYGVGAQLTVIGGAWTLTPNIPLPRGAHNIIARVTNQAGVPSFNSDTEPNLYITNTSAMRFLLRWKKST